MPRPRSLTDKQADKVVKAYAKGTTAAQLAAEYGVSASTILNEVRRAGGTVRPRGRQAVSA